jgi:DNA (cytosine-5)-methyltransferase 1
MTMDKIGIFSFFAGAGFLDLGFEKTGRFQTAFVNEYHKPFLDVYKSSREAMAIPKPEFGCHSTDIIEYLTNFNAAWLKDNLEAAKQKYPLVGFIGGPPCPDFSVGGKNRGQSGENGKLSGTYVELITKLQPHFFLFENVKGLYRTIKHREFFESLKKKLNQAGYLLTERLINAIEYGAPQDRERIILIGFHQSVLHNQAVLDQGKGLLTDFDWEAYVKYNRKEVFAQDWPTQETFGEELDRPQPLQRFPELTIEHWFKQNQVAKHPNANHFFTPRAGLAKFEVIQEGDDLKKSYKRLHRWRYSPTAAYGNNEVHLHPYKARRISAAEALAIQSLPVEFVIPAHISLTDMFKTIGNGVPFLAAKGLAETISGYISAKGIAKSTAEHGETHSQQPRPFRQPA